MLFALPMAAIANQVAAQQAIDASEKAYELQRAEQYPWRKAGEDALEALLFNVRNGPVKIGVGCGVRYQCIGCGAPSEHGKCSYCLTPSGC